MFPFFAIHIKVLNVHNSQSKACYDLSPQENPIHIFACVVLFV